ncbi:hypothetical protein [Serratia fonticola]|uniref:hypothetical protein n=1 Tax=Serratia fonticola TaxID=47917 RepID=UPI003BB5E98B
MSDKNFNPSWEGYMGDFLKGNVGINQLKPQHEFLDTIGLEKALSDNTQYHVVLTIAEAKGIIILAALENLVWGVVKRSLGALSNKVPAVAMHSPEALNQRMSYPPCLRLPILSPLMQAISMMRVGYLMSSLSLRE